MRCCDGRARRLRRRRTSSATHMGPRPTNANSCVSTLRAPSAPRSRKGHNEFLPPPRRFESPLLGQEGRNFSCFVSRVTSHGSLLLMEARRTSTGPVGQSIPRLEGTAKVTGRAEYIHNLVLPGMLYGKIFRSTVAH